MKRLLTLLAPLAFGLFLGKHYDAWIQPITAFGPLAPATSPVASPGGRGPASVAPATQPESAPEAALQLFSQMSASSIRSVCETARELYATKAITTYARYIRDFSNFTEHDEWLKRKAKTLLNEAPAWRGIGRVIINDSPVEIEVLVAPPKASVQLDQATAAQDCFAVQIFASREGALRQAETGTHCIGDLAYREGSYYFTWAGASGSLYHLDINAILIALPKSKTDTITFMADGRDGWQNAESFSWSPVTEEEQSVRLAQLLSELNL